MTGAHDGLGQHRHDGDPAPPEPEDAQSTVAEDQEAPVGGPSTDAGAPVGPPAGVPGEARGPGSTAGHGVGGPVFPEEGGVGAPPGLANIAAVEAQRDEYLAALQRLQADFENYRKRVQRQQEETTARAAVRLVKELLPALDVLDLARAHLAITTGDDGEPELSSDGQALVQAQSLLLGSLEKEGLVRLDTPGVPFDPAVHDAVAHAPDDEGAEGADASAGPVVDEVLRAGYVWQGQTLRPAMVRVRG